MRCCSSMSDANRRRCSSGSRSSWKALATSTPQQYNSKRSATRGSSGFTRASAASLAGYACRTVSRPSPRFGSTRSLRSSTEDIRPVIIWRDANTGILRLSSERFRVGTADNRQTVVNVDTGVAPKRVAHRQSLWRVEWTGLPTTIHESFRSRGMGGERYYRNAVVNKALQWGVSPIPLQHHKLRRVQRRSLAIAENSTQGKDLPLSRGQKLLHREFRRGMQICLVGRPVRKNERGPEAVQVSLISWRSLEGGRLHLNEAFGIEPAPHEGRHLRSGQQPATPFSVSDLAPKGSRPGRTQETPRQKRQKVRQDRSRS